MSTPRLTRKPVSRLVESLVGRADETSSAALLLKALVALDALHRGGATTTLLTSLAQQLLIAEALCMAGYESLHVESIRLAYTALVRVYSEADSNSGVKAADAEYKVLRDALMVYDVQLQSAPRGKVRDAEIATATRLLHHLSKTEG